MSMSEDNRSRQGKDSNALCVGGSESKRQQVNLLSPV